MGVVAARLPLENKWGPLWRDRLRDKFSDKWFVAVAAPDHQEIEKLVQRRRRCIKYVEVESANMAASQLLKAMGRRF